MTEIEKKTGMTNAECDYWDDYYTKTVFEPGPNLLKQGVKPGFAHSTLLLSELDRDNFRQCAFYRVYPLPAETMYT